MAAMGVTHPAARMPRHPRSSDASMTGHRQGTSEDGQFVKESSLTAGPAWLDHQTAREVSQFVKDPTGGFIDRVSWQ